MITIGNHGRPSAVQRDAIDLVLRERASQDEKWGGSAHDDAHSAGDWPRLIREYADGTGRASNQPFSRRMTAVAALGLAALESCLRLEGHSAPASPRALAYAAIDGERAYQDAKWPGGGALSVGDHLTLMRACLGQADLEFATHGGNDAALHVLRKVAALGVRCLEAHGAPGRDA